MAPVPNKADDDSLHYPVSNPNLSISQDALLNDFDEIDEEDLFECDIQFNMLDFYPISFESFWNEDPNSNIYRYVSEELIQMHDVNEEIFDLCATKQDIPTVHEDHCYTRNRSDSEVNDNNCIVKEKIKNINIDEEIENIDLNPIENFDLDESNIVVVDDHINVTESVLTIVNAEIENRPRRGRPKCINYTRLNTLTRANRENTRRRRVREDRENTRGRQTRGKKRMDEKTRAIHNTKERNRRNALKQNIDSLAEEIPNLPNRKPMNLVLKKAVEYIKKLKRENDKYEKELLAAKNLNKDLLKHLAKFQHKRKNKRNTQTSRDNDN